MKKQNRLTYAIVGAAIMLLSGIAYAWSVLSVPIGTEFPDWSKAQLSTTFTIVMICFCIGSLAAGLLASKVKASIFIIIGAVCEFAGLLIASKAGSLFTLYLGFGIFCGLGCGLVYNAVMGTVMKWFQDKPGMISGVLLMCFGSSSFLIGKLSQACTPDTVGAWRKTFVVMGLIISVGTIICSFFMKAPETSANAASKDVPADTEQDYSPLKTLRQPAFWIYFVWAVLVSGAGLSLIAQASGIVKESSASVTASSVATIVGLISIFNAVGRILFGGMFDKYGRTVSMLSICVLYILTCLLLIPAIKLGSIVLVVIGFIAGGLAYSGVTPTNSAFTRSYFGVKYYPVNLPMINANLLLSSFGSTITGLLFDKTGSYMSTFVFIIVLSVLGITGTVLISLIDKKKAGK